MWCSIVCKLYIISENLPRFTYSLTPLTSDYAEKVVPAGDLLRSFLFVEIDFYVSLGFGAKDLN
jgi:hypothetical protein